MLNLQNCLNLFPSEEVSAEALRRGDIFCSNGRRWYIIGCKELEFTLDGKLVTPNPVRR